MNGTRHHEAIPAPTSRSNIFVVHGHEYDFKDKVAPRFNPIIFTSSRAAARPSLKNFNSTEPPLVSPWLLTPVPNTLGEEARGWIRGQSECCRHRTQLPDFHIAAAAIAR